MKKDFTELVDLASERLGGAVLAANDEFFAPKDNLLKPSRPVFLEDKYTDRGKWMDGWETRRRRTSGHDWCVIRLGLPGVIRGILVDTSHFKGNYPEECSLEGTATSPDATVEELTRPNLRWVPLMPKVKLQGDRHNLFEVDNPNRYTHIRFHIYPDGGVARLRVFGEVVPDWKRLAAQDEVDWAAVAHGGLVLAASDMSFGSCHNLLMPGSARNMGEGWETRRRRGPGHDWALIKLGAPAVIDKIEVDTSHFKGNYPESCSLDACLQEGASTDALLYGNVQWKELLPRVPLQADTQHRFAGEICSTTPISHVRFNIFPDGGVARLRLYGRLARQENK